MKHLYPILISILFLSACSPYGYVSQMPVEPMFTEKNEGKVNVAGGFNHGEIQAAYSLSDHIGISTNQYFGDTKGYTAGLHLYHHVYRNFYIGLQGGFGENKLEFNKKVGFYTTIGANTYYSFRYFEPTIYFINKEEGNKFGLSFRVTENHYSKYYMKDFYVYGARSNTHNKLEIESNIPQTVFCKTFQMNYEKILKRNPKCFIQYQLGFSILSNIKVNYIHNVNNVNNPGSTGTNNNYTIPFTPVFFNMTFGKRF